jgi:hypothetical protein
MGAVVPKKKIHPANYMARFISSPENPSSIYPYPHIINFDILTVGWYSTGKGKRNINGELDRIWQEVIMAYC